METVSDRNEGNLAVPSLNINVELENETHGNNELITEQARNSLLRLSTSSTSSSASSSSKSDFENPPGNSKELQDYENKENDDDSDFKTINETNSQEFVTNEEPENVADLTPASDENENKKSLMYRATISNGSIPKSGKPMMLNKRINKPRGRPKRKSLPVYQSQISDNKIGIKLCIKKSDILPKTKSSRKRSRKAKQKIASDSENSDYEKRRKRESLRNRSNNNTSGPMEQSVWGNQIPENVLHQIFTMVVKEDGALPTVIRLGRVCSLWHRVSMYQQFWKIVDLSSWTKERHRNEIKLKQMIDNRLRGCIDLNLSNFKITNIQCVIEKLLEHCPNLEGISFAGWKGFTPEHLNFLVEGFTRLKRIDLSSINFEMNTSRSAVALNSLCNSMQTMNDRLTHINLANNRMAGIPQLITTLAAHCHNLLSLDLSNVTTIATSHAILHIEKLQVGCPKLKVLLITNSHISFSTATLQEQMDSPGFPDLEELSVASLADESRLINDEYLQRILKTSTKLKLLDVRGCARLTHDSLIRLPTWDLKHLFLSGCSVTRDFGSGLELIASKWAHSLTELDLAWANVQGPLDNALRVFAEKGSESPISHLNLCGSSVSLEAVKDVLKQCPSISSINLASCRGLPRGVKRLLQGTIQITELKENLGVIQKPTPPSESPKNPPSSSSSSISPPYSEMSSTKIESPKENMEVT